MSDELRIVRCQLGGAGGIVRAGAELAQRGRAVHPRMLAGPDDDVVREVWLAVWLAVFRGLPKLRQPDRFAPWLFTIARRAVTSRLRDDYARPEPEPPDVPGPDEAQSIVDRETIGRPHGVADPGA